MGGDGGARGTRGAAAACLAPACRRPGASTSRGQPSLTDHKPGWSCWPTTATPPHSAHLVAPRPKPAAGLEVEVGLGTGGRVEQREVAVGVNPRLACRTGGGVGCRPRWSAGGCTPSAAPACVPIHALVQAGRLLTRAWGRIPAGHGLAKAIATHMQPRREWPAPTEDDVVGLRGGRHQRKNLARGLQLDARAACGARGWRGLGWSEAGRWRDGGGAARYPLPAGRGCMRHAGRKQAAGPRTEWGMPACCCSGA